MGTCRACAFLSRAQAAKSWNINSCCAVDANDCYGNGSGPFPGPCNDENCYCYDHTASSDFIFRLRPGEPERFLPTGTGMYATNYQYVSPSRWPAWGGNDLGMGFNGPPGDGSYCYQGVTYAGSPNDACGRDSNWGPTDLEVWFPNAARRPEGR
eukprot:COSAG06_NODE_564_length_14246_cov_9.566693_15_plen_154_part_00